MAILKFKEVRHLQKSTKNPQNLKWAATAQFLTENSEIFFGDSVHTYKGPGG